MGKTIMDIRFSLLTALLLCCTWPVYAQAATSPAAIVIVASGSVQALGEEGFRPLKRRSEVFVGESVLTGPDARTQLRFSDGAIVSLDNDSELLIEAYQRNEEEPEKSKALLRMVTGGLRSITGAIADDYPEGYEVETPLASIGVRGTDFQLKLSATKLAVAVWDGAVNVANQAGSADIGPTLPFRFAVVTDASAAPQTVLSAPSEFGGMGPEGNSVRDEDSSAIEGESNSPTGENEPADISDGANLTDTLVSDSLPTQQSVSVGEPVPTIDPDMPDWFTSKQGRTTPTLFTRPNYNSQGEYTNPYTTVGFSTIPDSGNGIAISARDSDTSDFGYIFPDSPAGLDNKAQGFPVYWGSWNGNAEILTFFSSNPNPDGTYDLESYAIDPASQDFSDSRWAFSTAAPLSLSDINNVVSSTTTLTFSSDIGFSTGLVLDSEFSDGALDPTQSSISFDLDINNGQVIDSSGGYQFTVLGNGFEQVWESTVGASDSGSDLSGTIPELKFSYINTSVTNSDGSFAAGPPAGGIINGFIIPSDVDPALLGFLGTIDLFADDASGNRLSSGYVTFILEGQ